MPTIRLIADLRNTNEISELYPSQHEPAFITKNGYDDLVVMSMATYEKKMSLIEVNKKLNAAETQLNNTTPLVDGEGVFNRLRERIQMMNKPDTSPDFTIDDIHKIREYHYSVRQTMTVDEYNAYRKDSIDKLEDRIIRAKKEKMQAV